MSAVEIWRFLRRIPKVIKGKDVFIRKDVRVNKTRLGSEYGGWFVIPKLLSTNSVVYSFGIGEDISFDLDLIKQLNVEVLAFDPTPKSIDWLNAQELPEKFTAYPFGLSGHDGELEFFPPENDEYASYTAAGKTSKEPVRLPVKSLSTITQELGHRELDLLKADIEGSEYEFIDALVESELRPRQLLVEFHHRFMSFTSADTIRALKQLRGIGYRVFHVAATGEEICFVHESVL